MVANFSSDEFIPIIWHVADDFVVPSADERAGLYGVGGIPDVWFDGIERVLGGGGYMYPQYEAIVLSRLDVPSPLTIVAEYAMHDEYNGTLNVEIEVTDDITTTDNMVHFMIVEDDVYQAEPHVGRAMLESAPIFVTSPGETVTVQRPFTIDPAWPGGVDLEKIHFIAIVQSQATKEILQAAQAVEGTFTIIPTVDIKCNGSDFPVTVVNPAPITLDIDVMAHSYAGKPIDLWALITNITDGEGWAAYDGSWNFPVTPPFTGHALVSGPLDDWSKAIFDGTFPLPGTYTAYLIIDPLANNRYNSTAHNIMDQVEFTVLPAGTELILIWNPAGSVSGQVMADLMLKMGLDYELETGDLPTGLGAYKAVFVDLGIYANNHALSAAEGDTIAAYLDGGGNVYMEGGDTWYYDTPTAAHPYFGITGLADGSADTSNCEGIAGTFTEGMSFVYAGENNWMDHLAPVAPAYTIFTEPTMGYDNCIAHDAGTYKTIGGSFEFGGLVDEGDSTKLALMEQYLMFFGLTE